MKTIVLLTWLVFSLTAMLAYADTPVAGFIEQDTVWTLAESPYGTLGRIIVRQGIKLTIEPGVIINFASGHGLVVEGTLIARGTADSMIVFAPKDDKTPGAWEGISFVDSSVDPDFDATGNYFGGCILQYCTVEYARTGIRLDSAALFADGCVISGSSTSGIEGQGSCPALRVNNCMIRDNQYYGIYYGSEVLEDIAVIQSSVIEENSSGVKFASGKSFSITGNIIRDNRGNRTGGIDVQGSWIDGPVASFSFIGNILAGNPEGGLRISSMDIVDIRDNTFSENTADSYGAGIRIDGGTTINIANNTLIRNTTKYYYNNDVGGGGGGISVYGKDATIDNNTLIGNKAFHGGSGTGLGRGGGIMVGCDSAKVINNVLIGNEANETRRGNSQSLGRGGGIYVASGNATITGNTLVENQSGYGGAIFVSLGASANIEDNFLANNVALGPGGGICALDNTNIKDNHLMNNVSQRYNGGGIYAEHNVVINANTITQNNCEDDEHGNAIWYSGSGEIKDNLITSNGNRGEGISTVYIKGNPIFAGNAFTDNRAAYDLHYDEPKNSPNFDAIGNYWGVITEIEIRGKIYDFLQNDNKALVNVVPFLTANPFTTARDIHFSSYSYSFNNIAIGGYADWTLTVSNRADEPLKITDTISSNPAFTVVSPDFPQDVGANNSLEISVRFSPLAEKLYAGVIEVISNDPNNPEIYMAVQGTGEVSDNQLPLADIDYSPSTPRINRQINFDAASSYDLDGNIISYEWDFGDGFGANGATVSHSYNKANIYTVILTIIDDKGGTSIKSINMPISLYPSEEISVPASGPVTLGFANADGSKRIEIYEVIQQVFNVERAKTKREGRDEDHLFNCMDSLLRQLDPKQRDRDLDLKDMVKDEALTEGEELYVSVFGEIASIGVLFLTGIPAPFLGEGTKLLAFEVGETLVLNDIHYVAINYPEIGRMEIIFRPSQNKMLVNTYLECSVDQNIFIVIPLTDDRPEISWFDYISSLMWSGITRPPEALVGELQPEIEDVEIIGLHSPAELRVYDSKERVTGIIQGEVRIEIPDSYCYGETVVIFDPSDSYRYKVVGTDRDDYGLTVFSIKNGNEATFTATDVSISPQAVHQYTIIDRNALSRGEKAVTIQIDADGDGTFEEVIVEDKRFSQAVTPADKLPATWANVKQTKLFQNYPNPFNPDTWIPYALASPSDVAIKIHNAAGLLVRTLNLGKKAAEIYISKDKAAYWNGRDNNGEPVSSGVYFCTLRAGDYTATKKMIIAK